MIYNLRAGEELRRRHRANAIPRPHEHLYPRQEVDGDEMNEYRETSPRLA